MSRKARLLLFVAAPLAVFLLGCFVLPHGYAVHRERTIEGTAERVFEQVHELRRHEAWSPFKASDPSYAFTYGRIPRGVGASYLWHGEPGWGRLETLEVQAPTRVVNRLYSPPMGTTLETWTFEPSADRVRVRWAFQGEVPGFFGGWLAAFMDRLLGPMLTDGLERMAEAVRASADEQDRFDAFTFVLLRKGPNWSDEDTEANRQLMEGHLAHFSSLYDQGQLHLCGPFAQQEDEDLRGMCLYSVDLDRARILAEQDPRVLAGQLRVEVMTLWTKEHALNLVD
jgi:uncharacterized protein YciI